jgi:hypothetical protein
VGLGQPNCHTNHGAATTGRDGLHLPCQQRSAQLLQRRVSRPRRCVRLIEVRSFLAWWGTGTWSNPVRASRYLTVRCVPSTCHVPLFHRPPAYHFPSDNSGFCAWPGGTFALAPAVSLLLCGSFSNPRLFELFRPPTRSRGVCLSTASSHLGCRVAPPTCPRSSTLFLILFVECRPSGCPANEQSPGARRLGRNLSPPTDLR